MFFMLCFLCTELILFLSFLLECASCCFMLTRWTVACGFSFCKYLLKLIARACFSFQFIYKHFAHNPGLLFPTFCLCSFKITRSSATVKVVTKWEATQKRIPFNKEDENKKQ